MLQFLLTIFVNSQQRRLRAGWRIIFQALIMVFISLLISLGFSALEELVFLPGQRLSRSPADLLTALSPDWLFQAMMGIGTALTVLASTWLAGTWLDRRSFKSFGFRFSTAWWQDFIFGFGLGAFLMACIFGVELALGWIEVVAVFYSNDPQTPFVLGMLGYGVLFLCVGVYEETLSRGYYLRNLAEGLNLPFLGTRWALMLAYFSSSVLFGLGHIGNPNSTWVSTVNLMVAGLFLGLGFLLTGELAIPIGLHISWNLFQDNIFGFPVSGLETRTSLIALRQEGPELLTGGAFGPEAGLIGLAATALGSLLILLWVRWKRGEIHLQTSLAEYKPAAEDSKTTGLTVPPSEQAAI